MNKKETIQELSRIAKNYFIKDQYVSEYYDTGKVLDLVKFFRTIFKKRYKYYIFRLDNSGSSLYLELQQCNDSENSTNDIIRIGLEVTLYRLAEEMIKGYYTQGKLDTIKKNNAYEELIDHTVKESILGHYASKQYISRYLYYPSINSEITDIFLEEVLGFLYQDWKTEYEEIIEDFKDAINVYGFIHQEPMSGGNGSISEVDRLYYSEKSRNYYWEKFKALFDKEQNIDVSHLYVIFQRYILKNDPIL